jgi:ketosteroid isomerase-like protein
MRKLMSVLALVLLTTPAFAREKMNDAEARKIADQGAARFDDAWNKGDIQALGNEFNQDATFVTPATLVTGRAEIEKNLALRAGKSHHVTTVEKVHMLGPETMWTTGTYIVDNESNGKVPSFKGRWSSVSTLDNDKWRQQFLTINVAPPPNAQNAQNPPMAVPSGTNAK